MKKYIAEFIGTFVLVFVACGVAAITGCNGEANASYLLTALAFGGVIIAMAYSIGTISGCHINPAVSLAVFINGGMDKKDFIGYLAAQFAGGIAGAAALSAMIGTGMGLGTNGLFQNDIIKSLLIEIILTFIFVLAILGVTSKPEYSKVAGFVIGGSLTLVHLMGIYFTGTSVNPARSLGPALLMGGTALNNVWVFIAAPLIGGAIAALVWKYIRVPAAENEQTK
ncbi:aquaporin [Clostridiaceae bacterium DONG20-135]|uniref:Aquaporin n=1 Tax=Copranaerobaculum intestinale TaxID=2692629 RepID=A0A6N8U421_9FIRM|nr:aquaporin [Copranaerobaculum intestinale]MXQ72882.1 aquaporin [Copranaerobaculum intestinale]